MVTYFVLPFKFLLLLVVIVDLVVEEVRVVPRLTTVVEAFRRLSIVPSPSHRLSSVIMMMSGNDSGSGSGSGSGVSNEQSSVNNEWNAMAGDWDDLASGYRDAFLRVLWDQTGLTPTIPPSTTHHQQQQQQRYRRIIVDFGCGSGLLTEGIMAAERKASAVASSASADGGGDTTNTSSTSTTPSSSLESQTEFVCIDAAPSMIRVVQDKIKAGEWKNVRAYCAALATYQKGDDDELKSDLEQLKGTVDLVVASSVMSFIPNGDLPATVQVLASLLKPGGLFCHSDWPKQDDNPDGFTEEKAETMYGMGGLEKKSSIVTSLDMGGGQKGDVFIGVAVKPP
jgi:SAM-dependent methyltransferase